MITTLTGPNDFMLREEIDARVGRFLAEYGDMGLERLDGEETSYERLREALESLPFLAARKLVVLYRPGEQKRFADDIEVLTGAVPDTTDVLIVEPKVDKRSAYYKTLKKRTELIQFEELDEPALSRWLVSYAKERGATLRPAEANLLIRRLGTNQRLLSNEVIKLSHYDPDITRGSVELLTEPVPQSSIFDLLDAMMQGRTAKALDLYDEQRQQKVEPIQIIAMLAWQLHVLAVVKTAGSRSPDEIAREAGLSPYVVRKTAAVTRGMTLEDLKSLVASVASLDVRLKSEAIDPDEAMRQLIIDISGGQTG